MSNESSPKSHRVLAASDSEGEEEYIVESIKGWRYNAAAKCKEYFIKWKGYNDNDNTWEPEAHLNCPQKLKEFKANLPREDRRCFNHGDPDGLTGFQRHATFVKCLGADGPHESDEEGSNKVDKQNFYCLLKFEDSDYAEEVSLIDFYKHQPDEAWKFLEQRYLFKS